MNNKTKVISLAMATAVFGGAMGFVIGKRFGTADDESQAIYARITDGSGETTTIRGGDVLPKIQNDLLDLDRQKFRLKRQAVESLLVETASREIPSNSTDLQLDENEFATFLRERRLDRLKLKPNELSDARGNFLLHKRKQLEIMKQQELISSRKVRWSIPMPFLKEERGVDGGNLPNDGGESGRSEIVLFYNYHCPQCRQAYERIEDLKEKWGKELSVRLRPLVLESEESVLAAKTVLAALCANKQRAFSSFHRGLFARAEGVIQDETELNRFMEELARLERVDIEAWRVCLRSESTMKLLGEEQRAAKFLRVETLPIAFFNGRRLSPFEPLDFLDNALNQ